MDNEYSYKNVGDGSKNVTTAGTAVALAASSIPCRAVLVHAKPENTGVVVVGASTVVASASTRRGIALLPGEKVLLRVTDVSSLYLDSAVSGEGVSFAYFW